MASNHYFRNSKKVVIQLLYPKNRKIGVSSTVLWENLCYLPISKILREIGFYALSQYLSASLPKLNSVD